MLIPDVNVLVYAHRNESEHHLRSKEWLEQQVNGQEGIGLSTLALSGFIRVVTNPRVFRTPTPIEQALDIAERLRVHPNCVTIRPGARNWDIFSHLCRTSGARGNLIPDAYYAALAIEANATWITFDGGFGRFSGLDWRQPS
jgi:uncharacterized protein